MGELGSEEVLHGGGGRVGGWGPADQEVCEGGGRCGSNPVGRSVATSASSSIDVIRLCAAE